MIIEPTNQSKAFMQGWNASKNDETFENPYATTSQEGSDWNNGFADHFNQQMDEEEATPYKPQ